jgi:hypothetical protein
MSRILFAMPAPGYLRIYGSTVCALAGRGHEVVLAYDKLKGTPGERPLPDAAPAGMRVADPIPAHGGRWKGLQIELGCSTDYVRFLAHGSSRYLRQRMDRYLPPRFAWLRRVGSWPSWLVALWVRLSIWIEALLPVDEELVGYLRRLGPDSIVLTPLVLRGPGGVQQTQLVKAARRLRIPIALGVASWDHLSSKGLVRVQPDRVLLWNDVQRDEAMRMHRVPATRIDVTGAQLFDVWFGRRPSLTREAFLQRVGLPPNRPVVVYVGSSRGIARPDLEVVFVRQWLDAIRGSADPALRSAAVLVRPHYSNMEAWAAVDWPDARGAATATDPSAGVTVIYPRERPSLPMTELDASDYFHSLYFADAVVGINTSAMIEAAIVGRQVLTVRTPAFADTQSDAMHFRYLVPEGGGFVEAAATFDEHAAHLGRALADPSHNTAARETFVRRFVRPHGVDHSALDHLVAAVEAIAAPASAATASAGAWPPAAPGLTGASSRAPSRTTDV